MSRGADRCDDDRGDRDVDEDRRDRLGPRDREYRRRERKLLELEVDPPDSFVGADDVDQPGTDARELASGERYRIHDKSGAWIEAVGDAVVLEDQDEPVDR